MYMYDLHSTCDIIIDICNKNLEFSSSNCLTTFVKQSFSSASFFQTTDIVLLKLFLIYYKLSGCNAYDRTAQVYMQDLAELDKQRTKDLHVIL